MGSFLHRVPNIFDQYGGYENRLTHAILASLARSPRLLTEFLRWSGVHRHREDGPVGVLEQTVRRTDARGDAENRDPSLPDGWLECEGKWVLLIESKLHGAPSHDQLARHVRTAKAHVSRETRVRVLALSSAPPRRGIDGVTYKRWVELYELLTRLERNGVDPWPTVLREYMEILERELVAEEKPGMATLTKFSGIPFTPEEPYTYREAKRLMGLMREDLHGRRGLQRELGIAPPEKGRPAIRGSKGYSVWDLIRFKWDGGGNFGNVPHLDLFVGQADLGAFLWVPKHVGPRYRRHLRALGEEGFRDVLDAVRRRIAKAIRGEKHALPRLVVRQLSGGRGGPAWRDADVEFDLHVPFEHRIPRRNPQRKHCDIWLRAVTEALLKNPGLVELGVGVRFPYQRCRVVRSARLLDTVESVYLACAPLIDVLRGGPGDTGEGRRAR